MSCIPHYRGNSVIHNIDPRTRVIVAAILALLISLLSNIHVLIVAVVFGGILVLTAGIPLDKMFRRIVALNLFMLLLFIILPLSSDGNVIYQIGELALRSRGLEMAERITLRANAILLLYSAMISTMSPVTLGHALQRLKIHSQLCQLFFFTTRYISLFLDEYKRLLRAMKMRGFQSSVSTHTVRSYGYAIGSLLLRSFIRSDRIAAAMKCRGYCGKFYSLETMQYKISDMVAAVLALSVFTAMSYFEWIETAI